MSTKNNSEYSKIMFLFGAGSSVPLDIPAMKGIYTSFLDGSESKITRVEKKFCQTMTKEFGVNEDLEDFLLFLDSLIESKNSSLMKLVKSLKSKSQIQPYTKRFNNNIKTAKSVKTKILEYMSDTCFRFKRDKSIELYGEFIKAISKGYPIFSTNYDFVFEWIAEKLRINIDDNFIPKGGRNIWNDKVQYNLGNALTLIKLHGSVSWYIDDLGNIERLWTSSIINAAGRSINRLVVFPTKFKDIYDQHFFALYSYFLSSIKRANILFVIGHSLRDDYLRAGIIERFKQKDFKLVVIDPYFPGGLPINMKPAKGQLGRASHIAIKFEQFADELAFAISNFSKDQIIDQCIRTMRYIIGGKTRKIKIKGRIGTLKTNLNKSFQVKIDAYLKPVEKPANVRVWLEANYVNSSGETINEVSGDFLEEGKLLIGNELTGLVKSELPIKIKIPKYDKWLIKAKRVKVNVGIIKNSVKKPSQISKHNTIARDYRKLGYKE